MDILAGIIFLCFLLTELIFCSQAVTIGRFYWNSTNRFFTNDYRVLPVQIRDTLDIICPVYSYDQRSNGALFEYSAIYMVSERSYRHCFLDENSQLVGLCSNPLRVQILTVVFREFTSNPNMLEFRPGGSYYLISTSNGSSKGLFNRAGGLCLSKNMRLQLNVRETLPGSSNYKLGKSNPVQDDKPVPSDNSLPSRHRATIGYNYYATFAPPSESPRHQKADAVHINDPSNVYPVRWIGGPQPQPNAYVSFAVDLSKPTPLHVNASTSHFVISKTGQTCLIVLCLWITIKFTVGS